MKPGEKDGVMARFAAGELDILVSTTVVEVGVDVPNATVIIIENADRFGLSQLHQLRGRVGRSEYQSYAYLVMSDSSKPSQRLREIEKSNDGFYLAEVDLRLRGPGEIYGKAQHGALNLQVATLADTKLIARAQAEARQFAESDENLVEYTQLYQQVQYYQRLTTLN
jgi:ATP-dependent DNA helicase RecG